MNDPLYLKTAAGRCIYEYLSLKSNLRDTSTIQVLISSVAKINIRINICILHISLKNQYLPFFHRSIYEHNTLKLQGAYFIL